MAGGIRGLCELCCSTPCCDSLQPAYMPGRLSRPLVLPLRWVSQVKENFERFISSKNTIDDIYGKLRKAEADGSAGVEGTSSSEVMAAVLQAGGGEGRGETEGTTPPLCARNKGFAGRFQARKPFLPLSPLAAASGADARGGAPRVWVPAGAPVQG